MVMGAFPFLLLAVSEAVIESHLEARERPLCMLPNSAAYS